MMIWFVNSMPPLLEHCLGRQDLSVISFGSGRRVVGRMGHFVDLRHPRFQWYRSVF